MLSPPLAFYGGWWWCGNRADTPILPPLELTTLWSAHTCHMPLPPYTCLYMEGVGRERACAFSLSLSPPSACHAPFPSSEPSMPYPSLVDDDGGQKAEAGKWRKEEGGCLPSLPSRHSPFIHPIWFPPHSPNFDTGLVWIGVVWRGKGEAAVSLSLSIIISFSHLFLIIQHTLETHSDSPSLKMEMIGMWQHGIWPYFIIIHLFIILGNLVYSWFIRFGKPFLILPLIPLFQFGRME